MKEQTIIQKFGTHAAQIAKLADVGNMNTWSNNVILTLLLKKGVFTEQEFRDAALGERGQNESFRDKLVEGPSATAVVGDPPDSGRAC